MKSNKLVLTVVGVLGPVMTAAVLYFVNETLPASADKIGAAIMFYCENVPEEERNKFREAVNKHASPNMVHVLCDKGL